MLNLFKQINTTTRLLILRILEIIYPKKFSESYQYIEEKNFLNINDRNLNIQSDEIQIRLQQRTGRKFITVIEGLGNIIIINQIDKNKKIPDLKKILRAMKQRFGCNGRIDVIKNNDYVLLLNGDQRDNVKDFLCIEKILPEKLINNREN